MDIGNQLYWRALKNKYAGRRGFVIGNGPSLRMSDLDRLSDDVTIASNKIFLAFEKTAWRPTFYTCVDPLVWPKIRTEIHRHSPVIHLASYLSPLGLPDDSCVPRYWRHIRSARPYNGVDLEFSEDCSVGCFGGYTVTFENLQLAAHLGLDPIFIIGCDHFYAGEQDIKANQAVAAGREQNHFVTGYRQPGELVNPAPLELMNNAFQHARLYSDRTGRSIINATRGGHLEYFVRADLDAVLTQRGR